MIGRTNAGGGGGGKAKITLCGAPNEVITWTGGGTATLGADGTTIAEIARGTYVFTGGTSGYATPLTEVKKDAVVYVRPEKAAYWYGAKIAGDWVQMASARITYNANSLALTTRQTGHEGAWVADTFAGAAKVKAIITKGDNINSNRVTLHARDKWTNSAQYALTTEESLGGGKIRLTRDIDTAETQGYGVHFLSTASGTYATVTVYALWAE